MKLVVREPESDALFEWLEVLARLALVPIDRQVLEIAGDLGPPDLRSLDAVHPATTLSLGRDLASVVTYDARLAHASRQAGLEVAAPG